MKSKEEIEQLKVEIYRDIQGGIGGDYGFFSVGFNIGYSQCQEDMADVMENFLEYVRDNYTGFGAPHLVHNKGGQRKTKAIVEDFIESLNKRD